jgi:hypothetical protein
MRKNLLYRGCVLICIAALAVPVAYVVFMGLGYAVMGIMFWGEHHYSSGDDALKCLGDVSKPMWMRPLFPKGSIASIECMHDEWDEGIYWLRVNFKPEDAQTILDNLRTPQADGSGIHIRITVMHGMMNPTTGNGYNPGFWKPQELGSEVVTTSAVIESRADGSTVRACTVMLSVSKGLAYIYDR